MEQAAPFLLPLLLEQLLNAAEDEDDDDSWTPAMAAAICLGLCAQVREILRESWKFPLHFHNCSF